MLRRVGIALACSLFVLPTHADGADAVPRIDILQPTSAVPGSPDFTLTIVGTGLTAGTEVRFDQSVIAATCNAAATECTATVPASNIGIAHTATIVVATAGGSSNVMPFPVTYPTPAGPVPGIVEPIVTRRTDLNIRGPIAVGDFNADGKLDIAGGHRLVTTYLGDGAGGFQTYVTVDLASAAEVTGTVDDFNADRRPDLVVLDHATNTVGVLLGDGAGGFAVATMSPIGTRSNATAAADFDGDGRLDLAVVNAGDETVSILLGDGTGQFVAVPAAPSTGDQADGLAVGDFNRDGHVDLVVDGVPLVVLLGDGTGQFVATPLPHSNVGTLATADFNRDGKLDLAAARRSADFVTILLGDGSGGFLANPRNFPIGRLPTDLSVGDLNGDGALDLAMTIIGNENPFSIGCTNQQGVVVVGAGAVHVLLGDGIGGFRRIQIGTTGVCPTAMVIGDFNNDGRTDFLVDNPGPPFDPAPFLSQHVQLLYPIAVPSSFDVRFDAQVVGTSSAARSIVLTNHGTMPLQITAVRSTEWFTLSSPHGCLSVPLLNPGESCTEYVTFTPDRIEHFMSGSVIFTSNSGGTADSELGVFVAGRGIAPAFITGDLNVADGTSANLLFGEQLINTTSAPRVATIENRHPFPITIDAVQFSGGSFAFAAQTTCPLGGGTLQPGTSCLLAFTFTPTVAGAALASATLSLNGVPDLQTLLLDGTGVDPNAPPPPPEPARATCLNFSNFGGSQHVEIVLAIPKGLATSNWRMRFVLLYVSSQSTVEEFDAGLKSIALDTTPVGILDAERDLVRLRVSISNQPLPRSSNPSFACDAVLIESNSPYQVSAGFPSNGEPAIGSRSFPPGDVITWLASDAAGAAHVLRRETGGLVNRPLTTSGNAQSPTTDGTTVVFADGGHVYAADVFAGYPPSLFTTGTGDRRRPDVSHDYVVWEDARTGTSQIHAASLTGGFAHADGSTILPTSPGSPEFVVDAAPGAQQGPRISGSVVVWQDERNGTPNVFAKDLASGTLIPVAVGSVDAQSPTIEGSRIVFAQATGGTYQIFLYDLTTGTSRRLSPSSSNQKFPRISGDLVIWEDDRNSAASGIDLYGFSLSGQSEFAVDTEPLDQTDADINGSHVVFTDRRNGNSDVFFLVIEPGTSAAPAITCTVPDPTIWYGSDVAVACTATAGGSGLADPNDASFSLSTTVASGSETTAASTSSRQVCDRMGNCAAAGPYTFQVDKQGPVLSCLASPAFTINQVGASIGASVFDAGSGAAAASVFAPVSTSSAGAKQAALTGYDNAGNATSIQCSYQVNYSIGGFVAPVDNPPSVNTGKAGKVYPIKWQLGDATGAFIGTLDAVVKIIVQPVSCRVFTGDPTDALEASTVGNTGLRYDTGSDVYIYNWATPGKGCYTLSVTLNGGQILTAFFNLS